jgi:hypothetical protein
VRAEAAGELAHALGGFLAAFRDDIGGTLPSSLANAMRSSWRPMMMICSAPTRFAAITADRPTAPVAHDGHALARKARDRPGSQAGDVAASLSRRQRLLPLLKQRDSHQAAVFERVEVR